MALQIILFVISASLDNFIVGLSYGVKKIQINLFNNFIIAFLSGTFTVVSMLAGKLLTHIIPIKTSVYIGSGLLILLGAYFVFNSIKQKYRAYHKKSDCNKIDIYDEFLRHPEIVDANNSSTIDLKESIILGIALSMNNFGLGIGASIIGLNIILCTILSFVFSMAFIQFGYQIGDSILSKFIRTYAEPISGLIIIFLGIYTIIADFANL
jgi:putative sporulation protein YtaF